MGLAPEQEIEMALGILRKYKHKVSAKQLIELRKIERKITEKIVNKALHSFFGDMVKGKEGTTKKEAVIEMSRGLKVKKHLTIEEIKKIFSDPNSLKKAKKLWGDAEKDAGIKKVVR